MKTGAALTFKKINSSKELERELATAVKLFQGKETEHNWEKRKQTILWIKSLLHHTFFDHWKDIIIRGVHDLVFGIAGAVQSLRTKYVFVAFDLIIDIGRVIGTQIDATTFETLFASLLKCGNSSKQLIATKAMDTTVSFLSTTSFHNKAITLLCTTFNDDKSHQSRDFIAIYLKTCLQTHAPKTIVRENMERLNTLNNIEAFLKTGLLDATPSVRQSCRNTFWIYHKYWPFNAERLLQSFDLTTRKQLEKSKSSESNTRINRQNTLGKRSISPTLATNDPSQTRVKMSSKSTYLSPPLKRKAEDLTSTLPPSPSPLASASLLHLLRSHDISNNCNGLHILSKRLATHLHRNSSSNNSYEMVLPSSVPSRADLTPILLNYLSLDRMMKNELLCDQLMSWDCLAGIFVRIISLHHFLPTLILAGGQRHCRDGDRASTITAADWRHYHSQCALGLKRLKLYLKYNDPDLFQTLLDLLLAAMVPGTPGLRDPNAKNELQKTTTHGAGNNGVGDKSRDDLVCELIHWLDEIVCNYVGLEEAGDSDHDLMVECQQQQQPWATKDTADSQGEVCTQWLGDNDKLASSLVSILGIFKSYSSTTSHSAVFTSLITLVGRLRLVSSRVFDLVVDQSADKDIARLLDTCLGQQHSGMKIYSQERLGQDESAATVNNGDGEENLVQETYYDSDVDDPPPAYDHIFDPSPLIFDADDKDGDDDRQQDEPTFTLTTLNQQDSEEALSDGDHDYDVLDTSLDSINLEIISPEPSIASTQDPSELDDFTMEHTTSMNEDLASETSALEYNNADEPDSTTISFNNDDAPPTTTTTTATLNDDALSTDLLTKTVERLLSTTTLDNKHGIFGTLEHLCKEYIVNNETDYGKNGKIWMRARTLDQTLEHNGSDGGSSLLKTLIDQLTDDLIKLSQRQQQQHPSHRDEQQQIMAILRLLKQILVHQGFLFQRHSNEQETEMLALAMTKTLIYTKCEKYGRIPSIVDDIHDQLLATINVRSCMTITARLLKQQYDIDMMDQKDESSSTASTSMTRAHPMATLFNLVVKLAPKLKPDLMDEFLTKKGCSDCFIQGINHSVLSIRQSCVNALVALSFASGTYQDIKHYLPNLRKEQQTLLDYYINQRR